MNSEKMVQKPVLSKKYTDLVDELEQVKGNIANLKRYIVSDDFLHIAEWEAEMIKDHKRILHHHENILECRIAKLDTAK